MPETPVPPPSSPKPNPLAHLIGSAIEKSLFALRKGVAWWWGRTRQAPTITGKLGWLLGGLLGLCVVCSMATLPFAETPAPEPKTASGALPLVAEAGMSPTVGLRPTQTLRPTMSNVVEETAAAVQEVATPREQATTASATIVTPAETKSPPAPSATSPLPTISPTLVVPSATTILPTAIPPTWTPEVPINTPLPPTPVPATWTPEPPTATPESIGARIVILMVDKETEWVDIQNTGDTAQDLGGWILRSEKGSQDCPLSGVIQPGDIWRIWARAEASGQGGFNCGFDAPIWNNNESDPAVLINSSGQEVSRR